MQGKVFDLLMNTDRLTRSERHNDKILSKVLDLFDLVDDLTDL
jgi:hypothetical protein